jgi:peptidoglycan/xylan/chitin deacetylase (PgdA/CDA1 family)
LKLLPNEERVARIEAMEAGYREEYGDDLRRTQLTKDHVRIWLEAGCDIGNHTWDHPLLDRCEPDEQERQIHLAHEWIADHVDPEHLLFAYPNGNATAFARGVLDDLGYSVAALFDHAMSRRRFMELSRLRTNADSDLARFRAIVSGAHPAVHRFRSRV